MTDICRQCGINFQPKEWQIRKYNHFCLDCRNKYQRDYYKNNSEKVKHRKYQWVDNNIAIVKIIQGKWWKENLEHCREKRRQTDRKRYYEGNEKQKAYFSRQKRRSRKAALPAENFKRAEIFERDNWKCQICGRKVSAQLVFPHPLSKSIDHIIPISQGGAHIRKNVRLTHLRCNLIKNSRSRWDQLRIF